MTPKMICGGLSGMILELKMTPRNKLMRYSNAIKPIVKKLML